MDDKTFDLQPARNLFSKAQKISFGFLNTAEVKAPFISLHFRSADDKQIHAVHNQLSSVLNGEKFKLYINENGGDYLSISLLWESRGIIFSSSPDHYSKRECKDFRKHAFYDDIVKIFFLTVDNDRAETVKTYKEEMPGLYLDAVYYEYKLD